MKKLTVCVTLQPIGRVGIGGQRAAPLKLAFTIADLFGLPIEAIFLKDGQPR